MNDVSQDEAVPRRPATQGHNGKGHRRKRLNHVQKPVRLLSNNDAASNSREVDDAAMLNMQRNQESLDELDPSNLPSPASEKKKPMDKLRNSFLYDQLTANPREATHGFASNGSVSKTSNLGVIREQRVASQGSCHDAERVTQVVGVEKIRTSKSYNRFAGRPSFDNAKVQIN